VSQSILLFIQVLEMLGAFHFFDIVVPLDARANGGARLPLEGFRCAFDHSFEPGDFGATNE
jgi:hypothetical protein